jgi:hypothetical protein
MAKKAAKKSAKKSPPIEKKPRQKSLPGMQDRKIKALEDAAHDYADARDARMELSRTEIEHKDRLLKLMHKHNKKSYTSGNLSIELVVEKEKLKVKIKKASDGDEDTDEVTREEEEFVAGDEPDEFESEDADLEEEEVGEEG